jgi:putative addiction module killer protein
MIEIIYTDEFRNWLDQLKDLRARKVIAVRLRRVVDGNFGDVAPVGNGISELRIHYGPGYRVYFVRRGQTVVILLSGGNKSSQARDIIRAQVLAQQLDD